jgi:hypothetical protein
VDDPRERAALQFIPQQYTVRPLFLDDADESKDAADTNTGESNGTELPCAQTIAPMSDSEDSVEHEDSMRMSSGQLDTLASMLGTPRRGRSRTTSSSQRRSTMPSMDYSAAGGASYRPSSPQWGAPPTHGASETTQDVVMEDCFRPSSPVFS